MISAARAIYTIEMKIQALSLNPEHECASQWLEELVAEKEQKD